MKTLVKLPNGRWINPVWVSTVYPYGTGSVVCIGYHPDSPGLQVPETADEIADIINGAIKESEEDVSVAELKRMIEELR